MTLVELLDPKGWFIQGVILITGVVGNLYVARMKVAGFYYWIVLNLILIADAWQTHTFGKLALYGYFLAMAIYSIRYWESRARARDENMNYLLACLRQMEDCIERDRCTRPLTNAEARVIALRIELKNRRVLSEEIV